LSGRAIAGLFKTGFVWDVGKVEVRSGVFEGVSLVCQRAALGKVYMMMRFIGFKCLGNARDGEADYIHVLQE